MPRSLNSAFQQEKGKEESSNAIFLYELEYSSGNWLYLAEYDEDVIFNSHTYNSFPIHHDYIPEQSEGRIDAIEITMGNVSRYIQAYLESYNGLRGAEVVIKLVWSNHLTDSSAYIEDTFYIEKTEVNQSDVKFTLTSKFDLLSVTLPKRKFYRDMCPWTFKSDECGYTGTSQSCGKTFTECKEKGNETRFGGFPGIPTQRVYIS